VVISVNSGVSSYFS